MHSCRSRDHTFHISIPLMRLHCLLRLEMGSESERGPRCTMYQKTDFNRARQRESKQAEVVIQMISKQRYISRRQESSWREHRNRVETRKSDLRYNTKTQSTINNKQGETNTGRGSHKLKTEKTNKHRYIKIQRLTRQGHYTRNGL